MSVLLQGSGFINDANGKPICAIVKNKLFKVFFTNITESTKFTPQIFVKADGSIPEAPVDVVKESVGITSRVISARFTVEGSCRKIWQLIVRDSDGKCIYSQSVVVLSRADQLKDRAPCTPVGELTPTRAKRLSALFKNEVEERRAKKPRTGEVSSSSSSSSSKTD